MECPLEDVFLISTVQLPKIGDHRGAIFDLHCQDVMGNRFMMLALWEKGVPLAEAKRQLGLEK